MIRIAVIAACTTAAIVSLTGSRAPDPTPSATGPFDHIVVALRTPPVANGGSPRVLAAEQQTFTRALATIPGARIHWRYRLVTNGYSVVVPRRSVPLLATLPGVRGVYPATRYGPSLDRSTRQIHAPELWGQTLDGAGTGIKIGIIDDGVDQTHRFFDPAGFAYPPGYPKGQTAYTTPKVIVARSFVPPGTTWRHAGKPFDPVHSGHGTHVAGIAAGNAGTSPGGGRPAISGVAPRAYIGNYKALSVPTDADVGLDGNSPELVAAIEAAVADGMDVINLSLGEPEIEPSRDIVALALDAASRAGVVAVVSAGNDFEEFGRGSVGSPSTSALAISVGAVTTTASGVPGVVADWSSAGPTPRSLRLKPDVSAPGVSILSAAPEDRWARLSGTSMASPHVAGSAALLLQRHPDWTPANVKSALVATTTTAWSSEKKVADAVPTRGGSGVVDLVAAATPLVLAEPSSVSFGLLRGGATASSTVAVADSGGGAGVWAVRVETRSTPAAALVSAPSELTVPGQLTLAVDASKVTTDGEIAGTVVLSRGATQRRIPFWAGITVPTLDGAPRTQLRTPGVYASTTKGRARRATAYRYPELNVFGPAEGELAGPERVYRVVLNRPVANFGVVIVRRAPGVRVEPRIVLGGDESRLVGHTALPYNLNPYLRQFGDTVLASGSVRAVAGAYDVVFDSPTPAGAGAFTFRYWVNDTAPPTARLTSTSVRRGARLAVAVADAGSGIDPATVHVTVDGDERRASHRNGTFSIATDRLSRGRHTLRFQISDYQESRNMENVPAVLPNTRVLRAAFTVR